MRSRLTALIISPWTLLAAFVVAVGVPVVLWLGDVYTGPQLWPGLVGNFTASFLAFVIALTWDRRQAEAEREQRFKERQAELEEETKGEYQRRASEASRRLSSVAAELKKNKESVDAVVPLLPLGEIVLPQLLRGSWAANAQSLSVLIDQPDLVADLSTFYGRVEELQWRLRYLAETLQPTRVKDVAGMTLPLAVEMQEEVVGLISRVERQTEKPAVRKMALKDVGALFPHALQWMQEGLIELVDDKGVSHSSLDSFRQ